MIIDLLMTVSDHSADHLRSETGISFCMLVDALVYSSVLEG